MNKFEKAITGLCLAFGLSACQTGTENHFDVESLQTPDSLSASDIRHRWVATILETMQGETATALKDAALENGTIIGFTDNLNHMIGVYVPAENRVTLEIPYGLTEETFDELVLTGRRVMYEELDHAARDHSTARASGLSLEAIIEGEANVNEAIARIVAFNGMSEDAQIGSVPSLETQFGVPDSGAAVYYSVINPDMADALFAGLQDNEFFHERADLQDQVFASFFGTSEAEWYTLYFAAHAVPDETLQNYSARTPLTTILSDVHQGRDITFGEMAHMTTLPADEQIMLLGLEERFMAGDFTSEAEALNARDLAVFKNRMARPDNGPANHLARTASGGGDFFRTASTSEMAQKFDSITHNLDVMSGFFQRCAGASYIPENIREILQQRYELTTEMIPAYRSSVANMRTLLSENPEPDLRLRLSIGQMFDTMQEPLVSLSRDRVDIHNTFVENQERQCTYVNRWP